MKPATVGLLGAFALVVAFQFGRESVKMEIRTALSGAAAQPHAATAPFRVYEEDVIQKNYMGDPWLISCPTCCGYPQIQGHDRFTGAAIVCSPCNGSGIADVRGMIRQVVLVTAPTPTDYPRVTHRRRPLD